MSERENPYPGMPQSDIAAENDAADGELNGDEEHETMSDDRG